MSENDPIRLLLVDDHRVFREGLRSMLAPAPRVTVVGEAGDGEEALALALRLRPDVALVDLEMPRMDGIGLIERLRTEMPELRVLVLTAYADDEMILGAIRAGAKGYLLKGASFDDVLKALHTVARGESLLQPEVTARLLGSVGEMLRSGSVPETLTPREIDVLSRIARGYTNKAIGDELGLAERTVKFVASIIFNKLGVTNRAEAVAVALRDHLIAP